MSLIYCLVKLGDRWYDSLLLFLLNGLGSSIGNTDRAFVNYYRSLWHFSLNLLLLLIKQLGIGASVDIFVFLDSFLKLTKVK